MSKANWLLERYYESLTVVPLLAIFSPIKFKFIMIYDSFKRFFTIDMRY